ncbi:MAG: hypothetical protein PUC12_02030 [Clostridiales bacterium]|nr:hypothetical protein [Clostridiales bacterium]
MDYKKDNKERGKAYEKTVNNYDDGIGIGWYSDLWQFSKSIYHWGRISKNYTGEKTIGSDTPYTYRTWNGQKWGHSWLYGDDLKYFYNLTPISYDVTYNYDTAYEMVELTNEERRKAGKAKVKVSLKAFPSIQTEIRYSSH